MPHPHRFGVNAYDFGLCDEAQVSERLLLDGWSAPFVCFSSRHLDWVTCGACQVRLDVLLSEGRASIERVRRAAVVNYSKGNR